MDSASVLPAPLHLMTLLQDTPLAIVLTVDHRGTVRYANAAAQRCFGLSERTDGGIGMALADVLANTESSRALMMQLERTGMDDQPFAPCEWPLMLPDGLHWLLLTLHPLPDGITLLAVDITQRKQLEQELREHHDHLQDLVAAQTADLLAAKEAAERAAAARSEFLTHMSHELRTPMHAILSFAALGRDKISSAPPEKLHAYFSRIHESGTRLLTLVNDLLDLSRLEAGRMHYVMTITDLRASAALVIAELTPLFEEKQQTCILQNTAEDCHLLCDRRRIEQVMHNLLGNAIKFSPPGGRVTLEISATLMPFGRRSEDAGRLVPGLRLVVSDSGPGIPENELDTIFDQFTQSSRTRNESGNDTAMIGTGLGLAICRKIVRDHRGSIRGRNLAAGGTSFEVLLPRRCEVTA